MRLFLAICGLVSGVLSGIGGVKMLQIHSIAGNSVAEAYYNSMGLVMIGFGVFMFTISVYLANRDNVA